MKKKDIKKETKKNSKDVKKKETKNDLKDVKKKESLFKEVKKEMSKVHFPNKKEMIKYSVATICFVVFFGIYFFLIELIMAFVKTLI